jgi:hypothetical protein
MVPSSDARRPPLPVGAKEIDPGPAGGRESGRPYSKNGKAADERARARWFCRGGGYDGLDLRLPDGTRKPVEMIIQLNRDVGDDDSPRAGVIGRGAGRLHLALRCGVPALP